MSESPKRRRLSAIMFTDIEGYTSLMEQNERLALIMRDHHRTVFEEAHQLFNGKIVQYW